MSERQKIEEATRMFVQLTEHTDRESAFRQMSVLRIVLRALTVWAFENDVNVGVPHAREDEIARRIVTDLDRS